MDRPKLKKVWIDGDVINGPHCTSISWNCQENKSASESISTHCEPSQSSQPSTQHRHQMCGWTYLSFCLSTENKQNQCVLIYSCKNISYSNKYILLRFLFCIRPYKWLLFTPKFFTRFTKPPKEIHSKYCFVYVSFLCFLK